MVNFFSRQRALRATITVSMLAIVSACGQGLDYDLRGLGGGYSTADAASQATTAPRPTPDSRGIISYPTYQVALAQNGDTIESVATRLGLDAPTLARFNGIDAGVPLRRGEIVALPTRVAEGAPQTGPVITGPIQSGGVDIGTLASGAIDRSGTTSSGSDVRVAALPPTQTAPATATEPVRHKVVRGETAYTISRLYQVPVASLAEWNGLGADFGIREGQYLLIPVAQQAPPAPVSEDVPKPGTGSPTPVPPSSAKPLPPAEAPVITAAPEPEPEVDVGERTAASDVARMLFPVNGAIIREFSKGKNEGIDIKADPGTSVRAADEGTVAAITKSAEGIPIIVIRHEPELLTVYANVTDVSVEKGARVERGDSIAKLRSGNDAFVHFEVRRGFDSVDPMPYLR